jgi:hypothetical protein
MGGGSGIVKIRRIIHGLLIVVINISSQREINSTKPLRKIDVDNQQYGAPGLKKEPRQRRGSEGKDERTTISV